MLKERVGSWPRRVPGGDPGKCFSETTESGPDPMLARGRRRGCISAVHVPYPIVDIRVVLLLFQPGGEGG